ncbi:glycosyltransferase involved in cell wall biosynthesis [Microvirga subterranea]|uniref:Glycosyltransferase involved in cell wall biosynthesis n=2 Tax=Microvirga subterranea TaxID=186651 RepID=A0A370HQN5_9HYPH|nr:glycosyltransferase involved in cell wall biosynthesis [Microvirga subterranea]
MMRLLIATDAWRPQINGVVRSLEYMAAEASHFGAEVTILSPDRFPSMPMPGYPEIRLALARPGPVARIVDQVKPTHVHIATEGPIGFAVRAACRRRRMAFTTSYHTRFPEYLSARAPIPQAWSYRALRWFHGEARAMMVSTASLERELEGRGFRRIRRWTRGVDTQLFRPRHERVLDSRAPIFLSVGRIAVEKNLEAFLALDLPGTKVVVGDGPARHDLQRRFPRVRFLGALTGEDLARVYASADVFVFPSLTDTFGIVLLEALASGLPIAAYPVTGPADVIGSSGCGSLCEDLREAALAALDIPQSRCRAYGETFTWRESARQFFRNIEEAHAGA